MQQQTKYLRKWIGGMQANSFRFMSYNILADSLVDEQDQNNPKLYWKNRWPTIYQQVKQYKPDILCLQELDQNEIPLSEALQNSNYEKLYLKRDNHHTDGCAVFFLKEKFKLLKSYELHLQQEHLQVSSTTKMDKPNICLIAVLEQLNSKPLIIANSHLIFNRNRGDLKLAQMQLIILALQQLQLKFINAPLIWCGDFNLSPSNALYSYLSQGSLDFSRLNPKRISGQSQLSYHPTDYMADRIGIQKRCGKFDPKYEYKDLQYDYDLYVQSLRCTLENDKLTFSQEPINNYPIVETPIQLRSAYAEMQYNNKEQLNEFYAKWSTYEPLITTMSQSQVGCVDYVWINKLNIASILQTPGIKDLIENPIPNDQETSDHLPLICDFY